MKSSTELDEVQKRISKFDAASTCLSILIGIVASSIVRHHPGNAFCQQLLIIYSL